MEDKEKILRWDLQEAEKELKSDVGEAPLASMVFSIMENRRKKVNDCRNKLNEYLKSK